MSAKFWIGQHLRIEVRNKEHNPPHVHAIAKGAEAVVNLLTLELDEYEGFNKSTLNRILEWVRENQKLLLEEWENEKKKG